MSRWLSRRRMLRVLGSLPLLGPATAAAALFPEDGTWHFAALGPADVPVGRCVYRFVRDIGRLDVAIDSEVELPSAGGPVVVQHRARERWRDGWLYAIESRTRLGGRRHRLEAARDDTVLRGRRDGHAFSISGYVVPSSLWHPDTPRLASLLDSVSGRTRLIRGRRGPREWVPVGDQRVRATYWRVTGELDRELWYDDASRLVRVRFAGPDGKPVVLQHEGPVF